MFNALHGLSVVLCFVIFGLGGVFIRYFILIFPEHFIKDEEKRLKVCSEILQKSWILFAKILKFFKIIKVDDNQAERLKTIKNSIIVSTHPCFLDVVVLMSIIPYTTCFAAEKIGKNIFFKGMAELLFVLESEDTQVWEKNALDKLEKGFNVLIFPMGGRHKKDEHPKIRKGAAHLAQKSGKNIVMLKLEMSYEFLTRNQPIYEIRPDAPEYDMRYLGEINTKEMLEKYPDEVTFKQKVTDLIKKTLYQ